MWQRFTERARKVVFCAQEAAQRHGEGYVSTEHLLLGLLDQGDSAAAIVLQNLGLNLDRIREGVERHFMGVERRTSSDMTLTPRAKRVIDLAYDEARNLRNNYIGTEHLLLGIIREREGIGGQVLAELGMELEAARAEVASLQASNPKPPMPEVKPSVRRTMDLWQAYSSDVKAAVFRAYREKETYGHDRVTSEHLLLTLTGDTGSLASRVLSRLGATPELIRAELEREWGRINR